MRLNVLKLPLLLLFVFLGTSVMAQKNQAAEADAAYENHSYYDAISLYKSAFSKVKSGNEKKEILYRIGRSYYNLQDYDNAKSWLSKAIKTGYSGTDAQYYYAKTLRRMGLYDEAIVEFKKYKEVAPEDKRADQYISECEDAQDWLDNPTRYVVEKDPILNSKKSDFSPAWADKRHTSIMFTSTKEGSVGDNVDPITGQNFSSIWYTKQDKKSKKWMVPTILDDGVINNGTANEGSGTFDSKYKTVYFTRCMTKKKTDLGCGIYVSKKVGSTWSETELIKLSKSDTSVAGHPSIGMKDTYLFFASDMAGGQGGKDIWFAKYDKKSKSWGDPVNCGPTINTSDNEMFPYIHDDGRLFFASDGHPGMGSLDIFVADRVGTTDAWNNVQNMKSPINSSYNDFGIIFDGNIDRGYLTTDRPGGRGSDDIWSFRIPPLKFILAGTITDVDAGNAIPGVNVKLTGTDGSSVEVKTDELGYYEFDQVPGSTERYIKGETSYTINVTKEKYLAGKGQETTLDLTESTKLVHDFKLQGFSPEVAIVFPEVRYDLGKAELQVNAEVNSRDSLDFLYQTLIDNPTIVVELMAHTDSRGKDAANLNLSQRRAQSCVDYLATKGIPLERMVAKGYGERQPKITDDVINGLPTKEEKEAAHQKNRRTEFRVLRDDYVPAAPPAETPSTEGETEEAK